MWYSDVSGEYKYYDPYDTEIFNKSGDASVYAVYKQQYFTVKFDVGEYPNKPESQKVEYGKTAVEPALPAVWDDKYVSGWYTDSNYTDKFGFDIVIKADMTLYAKWEDIKNDIYINTNNMTFTTYYGDDIVITAPKYAMWTVNVDGKKDSFQKV